MNQFIQKGRLLASAHAYLRDADNDANSTHTRYSSAMNALGCLYHAGIASAEDWKQVKAWEAMRYDLTVCPTPAKVAAMTCHVTAILRAFEDER